MVIGPLRRPVAPVGEPGAGRHPRPGPGFLAKLGRVSTSTRRGLAAFAAPYGLPRPGRSTRPSSSCTTGTAPPCWRCRTRHRHRQAGRRDRRSGRPRRGRSARSRGTSCRSHRARRAARVRSAAARTACCTGRCGGCGWTGERARCSDYQGGSSERRRLCTASRRALPACRAVSDAGDARMHARRHRDERESRRRSGLFARGATPVGPRSGVLDAPARSIVSARIGTRVSRREQDLGRASARINPRSAQQAFGSGAVASIERLANWRAIVASKESKSRARSQARSAYGVARSSKRATMTFER